jgi:3-hydroxymyristoyl/3-hydroxydecanoyl-(acyl carrier protein) dehydratase
MATGSFPPARDFFPEVLIIEALCQAAACLNALEQGRGSHLGYLVAVSDFRFHEISQGEQNCSAPKIQTARPGDTLRLHVERQASRASGAGSIVSFAVRAELDAPARPLAAGRLLFALTPK